jgi:hypothetical protein
VSVEELALQVCCYTHSFDPQGDERKIPVTGIYVEVLFEAKVDAELGIMTGDDAPFNCLIPALFQFLCKKLTLSERVPSSEG